MIEEWDYQKNSTPPERYLVNSTEKVWWKCKTCSHEWQASVVSRTARKTGCPKCGYTIKMKETVSSTIKRTGRDLATKYPEIAAEWDYEKNEDLTPNSVSYGSNKKVWWLCSKGHSYQAWITDRTGKKKTGCPYCAGKRKLISTI